MSTVYVCVVSFACSFHSNSLLSHNSGGASSLKLARPQKPRRENFAKLIIHEGCGRVCVDNCSVVQIAGAG